MIDRGVPADRDGWPEGTLDALLEWEQGDIVRGPPFFYFGDPQHPVWHETDAYAEGSVGPEIILPDAEACPPFGMVTTQTCDIAEEDAHRPLRPWVQIVPVYKVTTWKKKKLQRRTPLYWVLVPELTGDDPWVADLRIEMPVEKGWLARQQRIEGFGDEDLKRGVGDQLALIRGRPAFTRSVNGLVEAVSTFLTPRDEEPEVHERTADAVQEVGLHLDSHTEPTRAQLVFLTDTALDDEAIEHARQWNDEQAHRLHDAGVTLQAADIRDLTAVSAADYRRLAIVWRR